MNEYTINKAIRELMTGRRKITIEFAGFKESFYLEGIEITHDEIVLKLDRPTFSGTRTFTFKKSP